jgi:inhibitor of cysteine peptidase
MKTTKKKSIASLIAIVTIVAVLISAGCIGEKTPPSVPTSTPTPAPTPTQTTTQDSPPASAPTTGFEGDMSVSELLESPVYETEVNVYGNVSALGELFCPCFALTSDGKVLEVWYDLMVEADRTERPAVSVEGIENGDMVAVTGELRSSNGTAPSTTFWASNIEKMVAEDAVVSLANVNEIEIRLLESFPVRIHAVARGEHPDSCTKVDKVATRREGDTFFVTITSSRPADAMCAQVMTPFEEVVALDVVGLKAGVYTVDINGVRDTFELQMDNIFEK